MTIAFEPISKQQFADYIHGTGTPTKIEAELTAYFNKLKAKITACKTFTPDDREILLDALDGACDDMICDNLADAAGMFD